MRCSKLRRDIQTSNYHTTSGCIYRKPIPPVKNSRNFALICFPARIWHTHLKIKRLLGLVLKCYITVTYGESLDPLHRIINYCRFSMMKLTLFSSDHCSTIVLGGFCFLEHWGWMLKRAKGCVSTGDDWQWSEKWMEKVLVAASACGPAMHMPGSKPKP